MTEQSNAELIAEARDFVQMGSGINVMEADRLIEELSRELEAADQRAAELAAVVEKVRAEVEGESGWFRHRAGRVLDILATAPAVALREVKAEAIREYVTAARENPHTLYWPASGVLDDAEQWADEIEKGMI